MVAEVRKTGVTQNTPVANTDSWLTRSEAASLLGCSENTIKNWQLQGLFNPRTAVRRTSGGQTREVIVYDPQELARAPVKRVAGRTAGDIAAKAFEMFESGESRRAVVIATCEEPDKIEDLYERWKNMGGSDVVLTIEVRDQLRLMLGAERITSIAELVVAIKTHTQDAVARALAEQATK